MSDNREKRRLEELRVRNAEITEHSGNLSPAELVRSGKAIRYSSKREFRRLIRGIIFLLFICLACFVVLLAVLNIKSVTVTNEEDFSSEDVIMASGISVGDNLMFINSDHITSAIEQRINYAAAVNVKKKMLYPSVEISLSKAQGVYYTKLGRSYYVLDKDCRVIAKTNDIEDAELMGCIRLQSSKIDRCVLGLPLSYRDPDMQSTFDELVALLEKHDLIGFCKDIILDSKFDITFSYKERFTVRLGDLNDLEIKFQFLMEIIDTLSETDSGIINVSDRNLHEGIVTLYN